MDIFENAKTVNLGSNKIIKIIPWKGKTKKDFVKIFKEKQEKVSEVDIINTLILPYINKPELYYSAQEIQYILTQIREISISDKIDFSIVCDGCSKNIDISTTLDDMYTYTPHKFNEIIDDIKWRDLRSSNSFISLCSQYPEEIQTDVYLMSHIEKYHDIIITNFDDIIEICDNLSIDEINKLSSDFSKIDSKFEMKNNIKCQHCNLEKKYNFDIIPSFFDPLLPKNIK